MLATTNGLQLITPPASEPLTLTEAKAHLRVDGTDEDTLITALIIAARQYVEERCWIALITQTWQLSLETWPDEALRLPKTPLLSQPTITAVRYLDTDGNQQTLSSSVYTVLATGEFTLAYGEEWPDVWPQWPIELEYTVGYGATSDVPALLKATIKLVLGHLFENREAVVAASGISAVSLPLAVDSLLALYEVR